MSTRQVASLLAAAAPEVLPPRDTLRAVAPDRYTLKVSIDQECEQGLRLLKDLMSHLDPGMSWGDLVARVVREAVVRHGPRGGGGGRRRKGADSAGASPRRAPKETRAAGAAGGPAQRVGDSSRRAPNRTRAAVAPVTPARRRGGAAPAPPGDTAATERHSPIEVSANTAPPSQSASAAPLDGALTGGAPSGTPAATSAPAALLDDRPRWRRSNGRGRRYFGVGVGTSGTVGWRPRRWRCIERGGSNFGAGVGARGTVGWGGRRWRSIGRARYYFGAGSSRPAPGRMVAMPAPPCRARRSVLRRRSRCSACCRTADRST